MGARIVGNGHCFDAEITGTSFERDATVHIGLADAAPFELLQVPGLDRLDHALLKDAADICEVKRRCKVGTKYPVF